MRTKRKPEEISQEDWDAVDSPELTEDMLTRMRPASEAVPEMSPNTDVPGGVLLK